MTLASLVTIFLTMVAVNVAGLIKFRRANNRLKWAWRTALASFAALPLITIGLTGQALHFMFAEPLSVSGLLFLGGATLFMLCTAAVATALLLELARR